MDMILRADSEATINAGFQALGAWREATKDTPAGPITQQLLKDGQAYFIVLWGQIMVPQRSPAGWTSAQSTDEMGRTITTWTPNGEVVTEQNAMGGQSRVMEPHDSGFYCVLRWQGDNPPAMPLGIVQIDPETLNPDARAALPQIA